MSLDFSYKGIPEETVTDPRDPSKLHPITTALIWKCLALGMRGITAENVTEFMWRLRWLQRLGGAELHTKDGRKAFITEADVKAHVGLTTNVTQETRKKWVVHTFENERHPLIDQDKSAHEIFTEWAKETQ